MITFVIDTENGITAYPSQKEAKEAAEDGSYMFSSQHDLDAITRNCQASQLIEIWNGIPGVEPVNKFTSRQVALGRIWKAIQVLAPKAEEAPDGAPQAADVAPKPEKAARKATARKEPRTKPAKAEPRDSKKAQVIAMIQQPGGATLAAIMKATDWQAHTVRGFMATVPKKLGIEVVSAKVDGERTYSTEAKATAGA